MTLKTGLQVELELQRKTFQLKTNLKLPSQGVTVLFGPSGSGKTSILRCVAGLEKAIGRVVVNDDVWQDSREGRWIATCNRDLGYVFQEASLFEHMNVHANLEFGIKRVRKDGSRAALDFAIDLLGIGHLLNRTPDGLSGGERQRVAIARALATQPKLLLLDEPLASLEIVRRHEILPWLERMHQDLRIPVLYVTHSMQELTQLADYVVLLERGRVKAEGNTVDLFVSPIFATSVGGEAGVVLEGTVQGHDQAFHLTCVALNDSALWLPHKNISAGTKVRVYIRANDVSLATQAPHASTVQNVLTGFIESIHDDVHPASCLVNVRHKEQILMARITRKAAIELQLTTGNKVWAQVKSVALSGL
jgi:molybdate transport system ATP-binding protein